MAIQYANSVQAVAMRVCKLAPDGSPLAGSATCFATDQFTRVSFTPVMEPGDEIQEKAANGVICVYFKSPNVMKKVDLQIAICNPQPEFTEILAGGTLLMGSGSPAPVLGWAAPVAGEEPNPDGVSVEVWSRAIVNGRPDASLPYWRWLFPYVKMNLDGERVLENGALANAFAGESLGNAGFADGPAGDWDQTSDSAMQYYRVATAPTGVNDYVTVT